MNFEERLSAAINEYKADEQLRDLSGYPRLYQTLNNIIINQAAKGTKEILIHFIDEEIVEVKSRKDLSTQTWDNEVIKLGDIGINMKDDSTMSPSRVRYYYQEQIDGCKGLKVIILGDTELKIEFVKTEVLRPLNERIQEVKCQLELINDENSAWKRLIATSTLDLARETLDNEILKLVAMGEKQALIYVVNLSVLVTTFKETPAPIIKDIESKGINVIIPKGAKQPKEGLLKSLNSVSIPNIAAATITKVLKDYYEKEGLKVTKSGYTLGASYEVNRLEITL